MATLTGAQKRQHVAAGEIAKGIDPGTIDLGPATSQADLDALLAGDADPMQVVVEIAPGKSTRGWHYTEKALRKLVDHVNQHRLNGIMGHQREEDLGHQFVPPATHWVGAKWENGRALVRGVLDRDAASLKRWIRGGSINQPSIYTRPVLANVNGESHVVDLQPLGIDWAPLGRAGMATARVAGWGEMDDPGDGDNNAGDPPSTNTNNGGPKVATLRDLCNDLEATGATPDQVIKLMGWTASDLIPALSRNRGDLAAALPRDVLAAVPSGEMAQAIKPVDLVQAAGVKLADVAAVLDPNGWQALQTAHQTIGEMAATLELPEAERTPAGVKAAVTKLHTDTTAGEMARHTDRVTRLVNDTTQAVPQNARGLFVREVVAATKPSATDADVVTAIGEMKTRDDIKPLLQAGFSTPPLPSQPRPAGEMTQAQTQQQPQGLAPFGGLLPSTHRIGG